MTPLLPVLHAISFAASPIATAPPAAASSLVDALFGTVDSRQAFARQSKAEAEAAARFAPSRGKELTYGEFDLDFFFSLLEDATPQPGDSFCDVRSGCGRLVLAAALAHDWKTASGVEVLDNLHNSALDAHAKLTALESDGVSIAPCNFVHGEASDTLPSLLSDAPHIVFVFATCWPGAGPYLPELTATLASHLPIGSRVVTVDKQLIEEEPNRWQFELVSTREAPNYATHSSVGYVYRLPRVGWVRWGWCDTG